MLSTVPECADSIAELFHQPAGTAVLAEDPAVILYELPPGCFTTPVLMPQLRSDSPDTALFTRCWDFVERIVDHPTQHVGGAVCFEVLDQLLIDSGLVETAWPSMKKRTRARTLLMLDDFDVPARPGSTGAKACCRSLRGGHFSCMRGVLRAEPVWVETVTGLRTDRFAKPAKANRKLACPTVR